MQDNIINVRCVHPVSYDIHSTVSACTAKVPTLHENAWAQACTVHAWMD